ncbi:hypothetical protein V2J09_016665 [Rumex salicifolius]
MYIVCGTSISRGSVCPSLIGRLPNLKTQVPNHPPSILHLINSTKIPVTLTLGLLISLCACLRSRLSHHFRLEDCESDFPFRRMSSQGWNGRRDRSRSTVQNSRQQWVPRGSPVLQLPSDSVLNHNSVPDESVNPTPGHAAGYPDNIVSPRSSNGQYQNVSSRNYNVRGEGLLSSNRNMQVHYIYTRNYDMQSETGYSGNEHPQAIVSNHYNLQEAILGPKTSTGQGQTANFRSRRGRPPSHKREKEGPRESKEREIMENHECSSDRGKGFMKGNLDVPQRVHEIQEKLMKGTVECMICCDKIRRSAPVWSCPSCYAIFHVSCIRKWARAPTSSDLAAEKSQGFNWRCPLCQSVQLVALKEIRYVCFCGKRQDPPTDLYLTPHSCGEPCGKSLQIDAIQLPGNDVSKDHLCPHICVLQCHPGPCPPCKAIAPPRMCPCGKKLFTTKCADWKTVLTCGQLCEKNLDCQRHRCEQICHSGHCGTCKAQVIASCFCMKKTEHILCGEITVKGEVEMDSGLFSCKLNCGKKLGCGYHFCSELCHPGPCGECELLPSRIKTCHCSKTMLQSKRTRCLDPIPSCSKICTKLLPCGVHRCTGVCHEGDCPPCLEHVTQKCCCGSTSRIVECYKSTSADEIFSCEKQCGQKKNCGRHRCSERCCPFSSSRSMPNGDWDPHLCSIVCGKKLQCGQHSCQSLCHSGHCPPCFETIFSDLSCACGRTSIPPPLPCGSTLPSCQFSCSVPQPCGHQSSHTCHFGDCPPCPIPVAKECVGGHVVLRNIPCGSKDIKCNKLCGKTRQCRIHACGRACHSPPCDLVSGSLQPGSKASCGQACGSPRRDCRHTCTASCHPSAPCPDSRCEFPVTITCSCGRIAAVVSCDSGGSCFNVDNVLEASIIQKLPAPLQPLEASEKRTPLGQRRLACDDECAKAERKRVLADAFDINLEALHFGESPAVSEALKEFFRCDPKWVISVDERCKYLVLGKSKGGSNMRVHVFRPMLKEKRDAVRLIAERWKLTVSSAGWEPKRFVVIHVTTKSKAPARMLGGKGSTFGNVPLSDPMMDMDPRLIVALFELPSDADINALVLRFGGECELVWLNAKNALAVFSDPARAATAMRRLDSGSVYHGAAVVQLASSAAGSTSGATNAWRGAVELKAAANPWKKLAMKESNWIEDSWGEEEWASTNSSDTHESAWKRNESPIDTSVNRWALLDGESSLTSPSYSSTSQNSKVETSNASVPMPVSEPSDLNATDEVADDWEKAYE